MSVMSAARGTVSGRSAVRHRLVALGVLGVVLTFAVAFAALSCLAEVQAVNRELVTVNQAQRYHQDADMMHDALRADVAMALYGSATGVAATGTPAIDRPGVRESADRHATQFRADVSAARSLPLPPGLADALAALRPAQRDYIASAKETIGSALREQADPAVRARYDRAFERLLRSQADVTDLLSVTAARAQRVAADEAGSARREVALASLSAVAVWFAAFMWLNRSVGGLHLALLREAEQRSAADLLQRSLLPADLPAVPDVRLVARSLPGASGMRVGGDWYDVFRLPTGELGLVIGDVVGHDLPAATTMGQLRNALRAYAVEAQSPAEVLHRVNRAAYLLEVSDLATCLYAVLDPDTRRVRWSSAGHLAPLVSPKEGVGRYLGVEPGPPLGVTTEGDYTDQEIRLDPGDTLVLYTDGLVEQRGEPIDTGLASLQRAAGGHSDPDALCNALLESRLGGFPHGDDVTLLLVQAGERT